MREDGVVSRLCARGDSAPYRELRRDVSIFAVPGGEHAQHLRIFGRTGGGEEVADRLGAKAERTPHVCARGASRGELRDVLERDGVHAFRLAEIAAARAERAETEIRLVAGRIERERLHVATERDVFLVRVLVRLRDAHELEGARCRRVRRNEGHEREESDTGPAHADRKRSAILEGVPLVDVIAEVGRFGGAGEVTSPVTGERALVVHLEVVEGDTSLGAIVLGDAIELRADGGARYVVLARRATFAFVTTGRSAPLAVAPPEIVPLLVRSRGGALFVVERVLREGARVRLRAQVEAGLVRDDDGAVFLDEVL